MVDPPWPIRNSLKRKVRPNWSGTTAYPTLSIEQIKSLQLPLAEHAFIYLWTTQRFLPLAFDVLDSWQLRYSFTLVWDKMGGMKPYNLPQYTTEFVLVGRHGKPKFSSTKAFKTLLRARHTTHSTKPEEFYSLLRRVSPPPRLDMFNRRVIQGFDGWGNEAPNAGRKDLTLP